MVGDVLVGPGPHRVSQRGAERAPDLIPDPRDQGFFDRRLVTRLRVARRAPAIPVPGKRIVGPFGQVALGIGRAGIVRVERRIGKESVEPADDLRRIRLASSVDLEDRQGPGDRAPASHVFRVFGDDAFEGQPLQRERRGDLLREGVHRLREEPDGRLRTRRTDLEVNPIRCARSHAPYASRPGRDHERSAIRSGSR